MYKIILLLILITLYSCVNEKQVGKRWSKEKAWNWYNQNDWLVGTNFNPSSSINQLEFWQADTFDPETIDRELKWSADLGMTLHRVYLHNLLWIDDSTGFVKRLDKYLEMADKYKIKTMFVLLDDVWNPVPKLGKQPEPRPRVHNSGWVQAPGAEILGDSTRHNELEAYIKGVLNHFANDDRVIIWDIYNEPDNVSSNPAEVNDKHIYSLALLRKVVRWAREVNPSQPITAGLWKGEINHWGTPDSLRVLERTMIENSDVITFHDYVGNMDIIKQKITELKKYGRPLICTEYLERLGGNTFENVLPILKENNIGAINWGLVTGKTNTMYPWSSWDSTYTDEPELWHHDIFRKDGTPFSTDEVEFLKNILKKN